MRRVLVAALLLGAGRSSAAEVPRLTGTLIGPGERTALFAEAGVTIPAAVGEHIGDYVVSGIEPGRVRLDKSGRQIVVSLEAAAKTVNQSGATFGLALRQPGPADN
ncbi:MAG: hypothetical protein ACRYF2_07950 [Janthinobacterium lividum]